MTHSEETKRKMREAWKIRKLTFVPPMKGKHLSDETRRKISEATKGRPGNRLGVRHTIETRRKISAIVRQRAPRGKECHSYRDGRLSERRGERFSMLYKRWRFDVFVRDKFTCQCCGDDRGGNLNAHHIKPFADYPELRLDTANGITLCNKCHKIAHG